MEETLLAYLPAILAVGIAVMLRLRKSRRKALDEIAALQKRLAALEQRTLELERSQKQYREQVLARLKVGRDRPIVPDDPELTMRLQLFAQGQREIDKAFIRLSAMKAELPFDNTVEEKYVVELDSIVDCLQRASGCDLSRWLGISSHEKQAGFRARNRDIFRLRILSLLAFCSYQSYHPQLPTLFPPGASRLIH